MSISTSLPQTGKRAAQARRVSEAWPYDKNRGVAASRPEFRPHRGPGGEGSEPSPATRSGQSAGAACLMVDGTPAAGVQMGVQRRNDHLERLQVDADEFEMG